MFHGFRCAYSDLPENTLMELVLSHAGQREARQKGSNLVVLGLFCGVRGVLICALMNYKRLLVAVLLW